MRTLKELYKILLVYYTSKDNKTKYICNTIILSVYIKLITVEEEHKLSTHFRSQIPTSSLHKEIYDSPYFKKVKLEIGDSWFISSENTMVFNRSTETTMEIRIQLLESIIASLE